MNSPLTPESVAATAQSAGYELTPEAAARIATGLAPAFAAFAALAGTLPLDLEPAGFILIQQAPAEDGR